VSGSYLWDRTGPPDREVERLEELLGELRYRGGLDFEERGRSRSRSARRWAPALAAAALLVLALSALWRFASAPTSRWAMTVADADGGRPRREWLREGDWLVTGAASRARLDVALIGRLEVEPGTRLRLLDAGRRAHRLSLQRGTVHARIWAPPGTFFVDTPSAVAVDLGCAYTLTVDDDGGGRLSVQSGWVGFERDGREAFVPRGAACLTRPRHGPGTPHFEDAPASLREALGMVDFGDPSARAAALAQVLAGARPRDALSLWHLLGRTSAAERAAVFDRLAVLVPPPPGVTRAAVVAGDAKALDAWWDALDLGSAGFWRLWKAPLPSDLRESAR
jgi:hypothetical protein